MKAFIVSTREAVEQIQKKEAGENTLYLTTNGAVQAYCEKQSLNAYFLDEQEIQAEYRKINGWGYEAVLSLIQQYEAKDARRIFLDSYFFDIKTFFIQSIKHLLMLKSSVKKYPIDALVLVDGGESLLSYVLRDAFPLIDKKCSVEVKGSSGLKPQGIKKKDVRSLLASALSVNAGALPKKGAPRILVSGSLGHLAPVLDALTKQKACEVLYLENKFNLEIYLYCLSRGFLFRVCGEEQKINNPFKNNPPFRAEKKSRYDEWDLTPFFNKVFDEMESIGFLYPHFSEKEIDALLDTWQPKMLLLDEDVSLRRALYIKGAQRQIYCAVLSHGVPIVRILRPGEKPKDKFYGSGVTFVNSEIEKSGWEALFYNPSNLAVTGTPRYDALWCVAQKNKAKPADGKNILFCASATVPYDWAHAASISSLLGQRSFSREYLHIYMDWLIQLLNEEKRPTLTIKPHYEEPEVWREVMQKIPNSVKPRVHLAKASADIFAMEAQASIVVTQPSSVVCEAVALDKPVIILNRSNEDSSKVFLEKGVAVEAASFEALLRGVRDFLDDTGASRACAQARKNNFKALVGEFDGKNTQRVSQWIGNQCGLN